MTTPTAAVGRPPSAFFLAAQAQAPRIVERLQADGGGAHLAEDVDLEARAVARQCRRHVAGREALPTQCPKAPEVT